MQTLEEYKEYAKQLEGEVKTWRDAYYALTVERNQLLKYTKELEQKLNQKENQDAHRNNNDGRQEDCKRNFTRGGVKTELENRPINEIVGDARSMMNCGGLHTRWERIFAKALVALYDDKPKEQGAINAELNILRNFVQGVSARLEKAEKSAREQDNHHYYKIFAEGVKKLLDSI